MIRRVVIFIFDEGFQVLFRLGCCDACYARRWRHIEYTSNKKVGRGVIEPIERPFIEIRRLGPPQRTQGKKGTLS
jgi:hypothetical protein